MMNYNGVKSNLAARGLGFGKFGKFYVAYLYGSPTIRVSSTDLDDCYHQAIKLIIGNNASATQGN
jgi:hypothetical protein